MKRSIVATMIGFRDLGSVAPIVLLVDLLTEIIIITLPLALTRQGVQVTGRKLQATSSKRQAVDK